MKKTFKIIMLPTEQKSNFACGLQPNGVIKECTTLNALGIGKPQHIYIISDEKIKEGDWYYDILGNTIYKCQSKGEEICIFKNYTKCKKIVATTDISLSPNKLYPMVQNNNTILPQLSESLITDYIKSYNEGHPITEVDLEVIDLNTIGMGYDCNICKIKIKGDNTVIITLKN